MKYTCGYKGRVKSLTLTSCHHVHHDTTVKFCLKVFLRMLPAILSTDTFRGWCRWNQYTSWTCVLPLYLTSHFQNCSIIELLMFDAVLPHSHQMLARHQVLPYPLFCTLIWIANFLTGRNWKASASCEVLRRPRLQARRERETRAAQSGQLVGENMEYWHRHTQREGVREGEDVGLKLPTQFT